MHRTILAGAGVLSASSLLLVDSAVKGTVLLALAAVAALILRRDSAATRHLVWVIGFAVLMLRLSAARWMLWNSERLATVIWPSAPNSHFPRSAIRS